MSWNYRVIKRTWKHNRVTYTIHETYYTGENPDSITKDACYPSGETLEELKQDFELYQKALSEPVLNWEDF